MMFISHLLHRVLRLENSGMNASSPNLRLYLMGLSLLAIFSCSQGLFYTNSDKGGVPKIGRRSGTLSSVGKIYGSRNTNNINTDGAWKDENSAPSRNQHTQLVDILQRLARYSSPPSSTTIHQQRGRQLIRDGQDSEDLLATKRVVGEGGAHGVVVGEGSSPVGDIRDLMIGDDIIPSEEIWRWLSEGIPEQRRRQKWNQELFRMEAEPEDSMTVRRGVTWRR